MEPLNKSRQALQAEGILGEYVQYRLQSWEGQTQVDTYQRDEDLGHDDVEEVHGLDGEGTYGDGVRRGRSQVIT